MNRIFNYFHQIIFTSFFIVLLSGCGSYKKDDLIRVLILSGKNNHDWEKTTPVLTNIFTGSGLFKVSVTEYPDSLTYSELKKFDVIVSNWNSFPDSDFRMTSEWENDFLRYVKEGGGIVSFHAGATSFYKWDIYHQIGIGRWGKETNHGQQTKGMVGKYDQNHPITEGLNNFYIIDEIWEKTEIAPGSETIAFISATDERDGHEIYEPAVLVSHFGKGRNFFTILGHDEKTLSNTGLQMLLLRGTQWAAHRKVTFEPLSGLMSNKTQGEKKFKWERSDTSVSLVKGPEIIWQYNFLNRYGKTYFHPLNLKNSSLTCESPPDHPWHLGLWFSWKFINNINYWEYISDFNSAATGFKSEGVTDLYNRNITLNPDFSSDIELKFNYHPVNESSVLSEERKIHISPPFSDCSYFIDQDHFFTALSDSVILDRTPISGEESGQSWGGYAGLSVRFNRDFTAPEIITPSDDSTFRKSNWLYMGFNNITGEKTGLAIFQHPKFTTSSTRWYLINDQSIPFFYCSPAILYDHKLILKKGENIHLRYRIWILPGTFTGDQLQEKFDNYVL